MVDLGVTQSAAGSKGAGGRERPEGHRERLGRGSGMPKGHRERLVILLAI